MKTLIYFLFLSVGTSSIAATLEDLPLHIHHQISENFDRATFDAVSRTSKTLRNTINWQAVYRLPNPDGSDPVPHRLAQDGDWMRMVEERREIIRKALKKKYSFFRKQKYRTKVKPGFFLDQAFLSLQNKEFPQALILAQQEIGPSARKLIILAHSLVGLGREEEAAQFLSILARDYPPVINEELHWAAREGDLTLLTLSLEAAGPPAVNVPSKVHQVSPLMQAILRKHVKAVEFLLNHGADPNFVRNILPPYLHPEEIMTFSFNTPLTLATIQDHSVLVDLLLQAKAQINQVDPIYFVTPVIVAAKYNLIGPMRKLLEDRGEGFERANLEWTDATGWTALMYAAYEGDMEMVRILVEAGADLTSRNPDGRTAAEVAKMHFNKDIYRYLLEVGQKRGTP